MLLDELFEAEQLNELQPYGITKQAKDSVVGAAKGVFGGGQTEKGNKQAGEVANALFKQLKFYVGKTMGTGVNIIPYEVLYKFMSGTKLGTEQLDKVKKAQYTPKEAAAVIFASARQMQDEYATHAPTQQPEPVNTVRSEPVAQQKRDLVEPKSEPVAQQKRDRVEPVVNFGQDEQKTTAANDAPRHVSDFEPLISKLKPEELNKLLRLI